MQESHNQNQYTPYIKFAVLIGLLIFSISTDQYTKRLAIQLFEDNSQVSFFNDVVQFTFIENRGGFLGIVSSYSERIQFFLLYICVFILLSGCLAFIFLSKSSSRYTLPLVFVTGGGLSNLLDRILNSGGVVDFVSLGIGQVRTGIFNLADVYILSGSFVIGYLFINPADRPESLPLQ